MRDAMRPVRRLRAAIIGAGFIGPAHIEAVRRLGYVDVVALVGSDQERAAAKAAALHIPYGTSDLREVLADPEIDVVHNCTPNHLHFRINEAILTAGKHVISEKPLAVTPEEGDELARLAIDTGLVNAVCFNYRAYPLVQEMRARIIRGDIGDVRLIHGGYLQDWLLYETDDNWRVDPDAGGPSRAIADIGSHWIDTVEYVTKSRVTEVMADLGTFFPQRRTEDCATVLLRFDNGAKGSMTISQISPGRKNRLQFEVDGSKQAFAWDQERPSDLWIGRRSEANGHLLRDPSLLTDEARAYAHYPGGHNEGWPDGLKNLCAQVYGYVAAGKDPRCDPPPFPTFATGARLVRVVSAILESSRQGAWVPVDTAL